MNFLWLSLLLVTTVTGKAVRLPEKLVDANNEYTIHLYERIDNETDENFVYSSFPTQAMLALVALGSKGETASEIKNATVLSTRSDEKIKESFQELFEDLKKIKNMHIHTVNRAYIESGIEINPEFKKLAADYFHTSVESAHFKKPKETVNQINSWVEKETSSKIQNFISEKLLDGSGRFVLVSTQFVRGKWKHPFAASDTYKADFHSSKNEVNKVDMMKLSANLLISRDSKYKFRILMLPYLNKKADLFIFLPDEVDGLPLVEQNGVDMWARRNFSRKYVEVHLPKFRVESVINMVDFLKTMGIKKLFSAPDLSGITNERVAVSAIAQKTYLDVNEIGTEASSDLVDDEEKVEPPTTTDAEVFKVDRPFIFAVMYDGLGLIVGRMTSF